MIQDDEIFHCNILPHPRVLDKNIIRIYDDTPYCAWDIEQMEMFFGNIKDWNTTWVTNMSCAFFKKLFIYR